MEFKEIINTIKENCGEDIARVVLNQEQKLKEADVEIDAGLSEVEKLKKQIAELESIKVENAVLQKNKSGIDKQIKDVTAREKDVSHKEELNKLKIENAEKIVDTLMEFAKIISGKEIKSGSRRKTKSDDK